jgi:hypothetical protein
MAKRVTKQKEEFVERLIPEFVVGFKATLGEQVIVKLRDAFVSGTPVEVRIMGFVTSLVMADNMFTVEIVQTGEPL